MNLFGYHHFGFRDEKSSTDDVNTLANIHSCLTIYNRLMRNWNGNALDEFPATAVKSMLMVEYRISIIKI